MSDNRRDRATSLDEAAVATASRLRARKSEIVQAIYVGVLEAVPDPITDKDPAYQTGVLAAISDALDHSIEGIQRPPGSSAPLPSAAAAQARRAARAGVSLGTVLRRYVAAHKTLGELIVGDAERNGLPGQGASVYQLRMKQEQLLESLAAKIEDEYNRERARVSHSPERRRLEIVQKLLSEKPLDPTEAAELDYEIDDAWHLGVIATGTRAGEVICRLKAALGCELLLVSCEDHTLWTWLSARKKLTGAYIQEALGSEGYADVSLVLGEPRQGISGWRLTHREAQAALLVALCIPQPLTRCADVPLEAAVLQADTLARLLVEIYLAPLEGMRRGGQPLRKTLRAYLAVGCNAATAAAKLGVDRHTVERHVRTAEDRLGRPLRTCLPELHVALRLEELRPAPAQPTIAPIATLM